MVVTLGGCSLPGKSFDPSPATPEIVSEAATPIALPLSPPPPPPPPPVVKTASPLDVAIIVSRDIENHHIIQHKIEQLIREKKGRAESFYLYQQPAAEIIDKITQSQHRQVVAIGLQAAKSATLLRERAVIFCQVYNYQDHELINEKMKGVSLVPAIDQQFQAWKAVLPALSRVGLITGSGKQPFIDNATQIAATYEITLLSRTVNSDKEMWSEFRHLTPQIDAFWLLPDNRILSKRTLRSMMRYSVKHRTPLFTINGLLLPAGAAISASQVGDDVAARVVARLLTINSDNTIPEPDVAPLEQAHIFVNTQTIKQFNLSIPEDNQTIRLERWPSPRVNATLAQ